MDISYTKYLSKYFLVSCQYEIIFFLISYHYFIFSLASFSLISFGICILQSFYPSWEQARFSMEARFQEVSDTGAREQGSGVDLLD